MPELRTMCGKKKMLCICIRDKGHEGHHVCDCCSAWADHPEPNVYGIPSMKGLLKRDTVEEYAKNLRKTPYTGAELREIVLARLLS